MPLALADKRIITLDLPAMVAGTKYRGDFEERIRSIMEEVAAAGDVILFIDEIHTIMGIGAAEGAVDAANIMKPKLARGGIAGYWCHHHSGVPQDHRKGRRAGPAVPKCAGGRTYRGTDNGDPAGLCPRYEQHHGMIITEDALEAAIRLSVRYFPARFLPDKALDLLDEAAARLRIHRAGMLESGMRASRRLMLTQREVQQAAGAMTGLAVGQGLSAERLENGLRQSVVGQQGGGGDGNSCHPAQQCWAAGSPAPHREFFCSWGPVEWARPSCATHWAKRCLAVRRISSSWI